MIKVIKRISKIMAMIVVYVLCAYSYMAAKGFIIKDGVPVLSNTAQAQIKEYSSEKRSFWFFKSEKAKSKEYARKIEGDIVMASSLMRFKGSATAPLTMYSYSSMTCSHCGDFHIYTLPKLERDFVSTGKLRIVFVQLPYDENSMRAAKLSYCLPKDKYDDFVSRLYRSRNWAFSQKEEVLNKYAIEFGMTEKEIQACKDNKLLTSDILLTRDKATETFNIQATPSFIVEGKDGKELITGISGYDKLKKYLNQRLEKNM